MYEYLDNKEFLRRFDLEERKVQYIRITVLDFHNEAAIASVEGIATGGTVNLNGSSNVRRTMSCSLLVVPEGVSKQGSLENIKYNNITEVQNLISINKKIRTEIGFKNSLAWDEECYPELDVIWFPLGTFVIKNASVAKSNSGINISLTLNDKTTMLNGDVGGDIPAATVFSENELYNADASQREVEKILIKDIIKYLVVDFGGEHPGNVIIEDVPDTIRKVMKWSGEKDLYYYDSPNKIFVTEVQTDANGNAIEPSQIFEFGQDCGYVIEPFCYPGTLECSAGETVAAMLDKIKNTLGNYEWFYDVWGRFHFQQKKNYINTSKATDILNLSEKGYLSTMNLSKTVYTFDSSNKKLLTNISNAPQYTNVKNDFVVWGSTKTASGATKPIRYHLAFDTKPVLKPEGVGRPCIVYTDYRGLQQIIILNDSNRRFGAHMNEDDEAKKYYYLIREDNLANESNYLVEHWDEENQIFRIFPELEYCFLQTDDWRTELYFLGLENPNKTFAKNYYAAELNAEWPKIYNVRAKEETSAIPKLYSGAYRTDVKPSQYEYWLDFIEGNEGGNINLSQFNVNNIGRRTKIGKDNSSNCIFTTEVPNFLFINADGDVSQEYLDAQDFSGYEIIQVNEDIFENLVLGGNSTSAYDKIKELLIQHTNYNEAINLTTIPLYHLKPNTRIHIEDTETGINGDYMINTISLPLGIGTSSISCTRCLENTI